MFLKQIDDLEKIAYNMQKQGKSKEQIRRTIGLYLTESRKKLNPNGEKDVI